MIAAPRPRRGARRAGDSGPLRRRRGGRPADAAVQVLINGDNANTATTVMGYASGLVSARVGALRGPGARWDRRRRRSLTLEPRVWYNPELRSTLFLVPGLIAYIAMLTAVVSTALSVVREKEAGHDGAGPDVADRPGGLRARQDGAVFRHLAGLVDGRRGACRWCCSTCRCAGRGWCSSAAVSLFLVGALAFGLLISTHRRNAAGGVSDGAADVVPADADALGLHLSDLEHAGVPAGGHHVVPARYFLSSLRGILLKGVGAEPCSGADLVALAVLRRSCCWAWRRCG